MVPVPFYSFFNCLLHVQLDLTLSLFFQTNPRIFLRDWFWRERKIGSHRVFRNARQNRRSSWETWNDENLQKGWRQWWWNGFVSRVYGCICKWQQQQVIPFIGLRIHGLIFSRLKFRRFFLSNGVHFGKISNPLWINPSHSQLGTTEYSLALRNDTQNRRNKESKRKRMMSSSAPSTMKNSDIQEGLAFFWRHDTNLDGRLDIVGTKIAENNY